MADHLKCVGGPRDGEVKILDVNMRAWYPFQEADDIDPGFYERSGRELVWRSTPDTEGETE